MKAFYYFVKDARQKLGFKTAKEFYRQKSTYLSMSYETYSNIEAGRGLPSSDKLSQLIDALEITDISAFVYSYCYELMPTDFLKNVFQGQLKGSTVVASEGFTNYKEKFQALLEFNRLQAKYELNENQLKILEEDLVCWDIVNLFVSRGDEGLAAEEIAEKTNSIYSDTLHRIKKLVEVQVLKKLEDGKYLASQYAYIIPRKPSGDKLSHGLVKRELENTFKDKRNKPYTRFRFLSLKPEDREKIETLIDNLILDCRQHKSASGKTHYLQILFSDRNDL